ncbi:hypothetical protein LINGRAHAP2_LOCUS14811, partial [Linum grandiflorum]
WKNDAYCFVFFHILDLRWVLDNGPWTYNSWLVVMAEIKNGQLPTQVPLTESEFWIQGHDLPASFCTEAVGKVIANHAGQFVSMDVDHKFTMEEPFIRLRVRLDGWRPLRKEKKIRRLGGGNG